MRAVVVAALFTAACHAGPRPTLVTTGEASHWGRTGRYAKTNQQRHNNTHTNKHKTNREIGRTAEDRPLVALEIARSSGPWIYMEAGIHAGEIEGKDAVCWFLRDVLDGKSAPGVLDHVNFVFVPVVCPDGHERFSANNRPNQRGPAEMGFRTNAERLNINRDWMKAETEEVRAILRVVNQRAPVVFVDLHTTDGAKIVFVV